LHIQLSDPTLADELIDFLRRRECRAEQVKPGVVQIEAHPTLAPDRAQLELDLLLRVWQSLHPGVELRSPNL